MEMSTTRNAENIARLPKWAQHKIASLEGQLAEERKRIAQMNGHGEHTNTVADPYHDQPRPLARDAQVEFRLDTWNDDRGWRQYVRVSVRRDSTGRSYVEMHGGDSLVIEPWSTNLFRVRLAR
jgi:hypothetical protein